jgi:hypothetical protein
VRGTLTKYEIDQNIDIGQFIPRSSSSLHTFLPAGLPVLLLYLFFLFDLLPSVVVMVMVMVVAMT